MKKNIPVKDILLSMLLLIITVTSCNKIGVGFLSDGLYVPDSPIQLDRGATLQTSSAIQVDGSSSPISFKLLDVRRVGSDKTAPEFYTTQQIYVYTEAIDPASDTTIELVNKKRSLKELPPFQFTSAGQFIFNSGTASLPVDAMYEYDVQASNSAGSKVYKNIGLIHVIETDPFVLESGAASWFRDFGTQNGGLPTPTVTITKVADTGANAILKITDENGTIFNPKTGQIIARGDRPTFESYAKFHPIQYTDSTMTCNFEIAPFPLQQISGFGHLIYYRLPMQFVTIDPGILPATENGFTHSVNPRFAFTLKKVGTYLISIKLNGVVHN